jgi:hypothetical protein
VSCRDAKNSHEHVIYVGVSVGVVVWFKRMLVSLCRTDQNDSKKKKREIWDYPAMGGRGY